MAPGRLRAQNLTASGDFKPFRDGFPGFTAGNWLGHEARKIDAADRMTNCFCLLPRQIPKPKHQAPNNLQCSHFRDILRSFHLELGF